MRHERRGEQVRAQERRQPPHWRAAPVPQHRLGLAPQEAQGTPQGCAQGLPVRQMVVAVAVMVVVAVVARVLLPTVGRQHRRQGGATFDGKRGARHDVTRLPASTFNSDYPHLLDRSSYEWLLGSSSNTFTPLLSLPLAVSRRNNFHMGTSMKCLPKTQPCTSTHTNC